MKLQWTMLLALVAFCLGFLANGALGGVSRKELPDSPTRPRSVPAEALWAGGPDGGAWVDCTQSPTGSFHCEVFADVTGALIERGEFSLKLARPNETVDYTFYSSRMIRVGSALLERVGDSPVTK